MHARYSSKTHRSPRASCCQVLQADAFRRPLDAALQGQLDRYLELLASTHSTGLRHLTLDALGTGARQLHVSYISEVPVWKSTYRIVFPKSTEQAAILQGWAVVDNTVGADWDNVQLSLVAGYALTSFAQVEAGYGHLFSGDYIAQSQAHNGGARDADFVYVQTSFKF